MSPFSLSLLSLLCLASAAPLALEAMSSAMKAQFSALSPDAQELASAQLETMGAFDAQNTRLDNNGHFFFVEQAPDAASAPPPPRPGIQLDGRARRTISDQQPTRSANGIPVLHSLPGCRNVIYLNFLGGPVSGRAWNDVYSLPPFVARPYSLDGVASFSVAELASIVNIWRRVAEDYSPWQVDVTTELPAGGTAANPLGAASPTVMVVFITSRTSTANTALPSAGAGGIAYVDVFNFYDAAYYSPAFVYFDNLVGGREDVVAEATSHETGHLFGLGHDGVTGGSPYFSGMGDSGSKVSWGPIMGASYYRSIVKFDNGNYPGANNLQDDVAMITSRIPLRADDAGNTIATATPLSNLAGSFSTSGILETVTDLDVYSLATSGGAASFTARPFISSMNTAGGNVDLALTLLNSAGVVVASATPTDDTVATISIPNLPAGTYFVQVQNVANAAAGLVAYGGTGQYSLSGSYPVAVGGRQIPTTAPPTPTTTTTTTTVGNVAIVGPVIYSASMTTYPAGWSVNVAGTWSYARPAASTADPKGFFVIGNVLTGTGLYPDGITGSQQIISRAFATTGRSRVTLTFDRFLGVAANDVVTIHGCTTGANAACLQLWRNSGAVIDTAWTIVTYALPAALLNRPSIQIRFGLGPTVASGTSFGWNIKNFVINGQ